MSQKKRLKPINEKEYLDFFRNIGTATVQRNTAQLGDCIDNLEQNYIQGKRHKELLTGAYPNRGGLYEDMGQAESRPWPTTTEP